MRHIIKFALILIFGLSTTVAAHAQSGWVLQRSAAGTVGLRNPALATVMQFTSERNGRIVTIVATSETPEGLIIVNFLTNKTNGTLRISVTKPDRDDQTIAATDTALFGDLLESVRDPDFATSIGRSLREQDQDVLGDSLPMLFEYLSIAPVGVPLIYPPGVDETRSMRAGAG